MPEPSTVPSAGSLGGAGWYEVARASTEPVGADPESTWVDALGDPGRLDPTTGEWSARCPNPAHNGDGDTKASLRWRTAPDGSILIHCHGGCEYADILGAVSLYPVQLRPAKVRYHYRDLGRSIVATKMRVESVNGKTFSWSHEEDGETVPGRGGDAPPLWLHPDLVEWATTPHDGATKGLRGEGPGVRALWLTEGEKDALFASWALEPARGRGWQPPGEDAWSHAVTTSGGANDWDDRQTDAVREIVLAATADGSRVVVRIAADSDPAGQARVTRIESDLGAILEGVATVEVWRWAAKDIAAAISKHGASWWREAEVGEEIDPYSIATEESGGLKAGVPPRSITRREMLLKEIVTPKGTVVTKVVMTVAPRVVGVEVDYEGEVTAWHLTWSTRTGKPVRVTTRDTGSRRAWETNVASRYADLGTSASGPEVAAYLRYHGTNAERVVVRGLRGWNRTGDEDGWSFVAYDRALIGEGRAAQFDSEPHWHYGSEVNEAEAARLVAEVLSFRAAAESGPALGALAANAVRPYADQACGANRLIQIWGESGTGKTEWVRLATRLFGLAVPGGSFTVAALKAIAATGTGPIWIDDPGADDGRILTAELRAMVTGGGRTKRSVEDGINATERNAAAAYVVFDAETPFGLSERAIRERVVVVEFNEMARHRKSRRDALRAQWADMVELGAGAIDPAATRRLTRAAGTVVTGLVGVAKGLTDEGGATGARHLIAATWVRYGARVLAAWLNRNGQPDAAEELLAGVEAWAGAAEFEATRMFETGLDSWVFELLAIWHARVGDRTEMLEVWRGKERAAGHAPVIPVVYETDSMLVNPDALRRWALSDEGRRAGVDDSIRRHLTAPNPIRHQLVKAGPEEIRTRMGASSPVKRRRVPISSVEDR